MPFLKKKIVHWDHDPAKSSDLIWRITNKTDPKVKDIDEIQLEDYERAVFKRESVLWNVLSCGRHTVTKDVSDIFWIDVFPKTLEFGIPIHNGPITKDNYQIGLCGSVKFKIMASNALKVFLSELVASSSSFNVDQLADWLRKDFLSNVLCELIRKVPLKEFRTGYPQYGEELKSALNSSTSRFGVEILSIEISGMTEPKKIELERKH